MFIQNIPVVKNQPLSITFNEVIEYDSPIASLEIVYYFNNEERGRHSSLVESSGEITLTIDEATVNALVYHRYTYKILAILDSGATKIPFWGAMVIETT